MHAEVEEIVRGGSEEAVCDANDDGKRLWSSAHTRTSVVGVLPVRLNFLNPYHKHARLALRIVGMRLRRPMRM